MELSKSQHPPKGQSKSQAVSAPVLPLLLAGQIPLLAVSLGWAGDESGREDRLPRKRQEMRLLESHLNQLKTLFPWKKTGAKADPSWPAW